MSRREASVATQANTPSQERDPLGRLTRIFAGILGLVFLLLGLGLCIREIHFGGTAQPAAGTIAEVRVKESADGPDYYPVVEFKTAEGRVVRFEGISTSPAPVAGTPIRVFTTQPTQNRPGSTPMPIGGCSQPCSLQSVWFCCSGRGSGETNGTPSPFEDRPRMSQAMLYTIGAVVVVLILILLAFRDPYDED